MYFATGDVVVIAVPVAVAFAAAAAVRDDSGTLARIGVVFAGTAASVGFDWDTAASFENALGQSTAVSVVVVVVLLVLLVVAGSRTAAWAEVVAGSDIAD